MNTGTHSDLEKAIGIIELATEEEFMAVLTLDRAMIYWQVNWSGPERISRYVVYMALHGLEDLSFPLFKIDCSDSSRQYAVDWLFAQIQKGKAVKPGGNGEVLLVGSGEIIDFISNPGLLGLEGTKASINAWRKF